MKSKQWWNLCGIKVVKFWAFWVQCCLKPWTTAECTTMDTWGRFMFPRPIGEGGIHSLQERSSHFPVWVEGEGVGEMKRLYIYEMGFPISFPSEIIYILRRKQDIQLPPVCHWTPSPINLRLFFYRFFIHRDHGHVTLTYFFHQVLYTSIKMQWRCLVYWHLVNLLFAQ